MLKNRPLVDADYLLKKIPGKGGWTYAEIPEIIQSKRNPFGWVTVKGLIDDFELQQYKLMPMGNGKLFLPVKASIRKIINKEAGDFVRICLYPDLSKVKIPSEIIDCLNNESPQMLEAFTSLPEGDKKGFVDWIYAGKTDETKAKRIAAMLDKLLKGKRFYK